MAVSCFGYASPETTIRVGWTVDFPGNNRGRPFNAIRMLVRLLSRTGAPATIGFASATAHPDGRYAAGGERSGGWDRRHPHGAENDPFTSPGGVRCDVAALRSTLAAFVRAYNRGDLRRLDRLFSREHFVWYSWGDTARSDALIPNFQRRYQPAIVCAPSPSGSTATSGSETTATSSCMRAADDLRDGSWFPMTGKGALGCSNPPVTIALMLLGSR